VKENSQEYDIIIIIYPGGGMGSDLAVQHSNNLWWRVLEPNLPIMN